MTSSLLEAQDDAKLSNSPSFVERQFVHDVYNEIAHCFSFPDANRLWPRVSAFLDGLQDGALVCDVGCGDGKYMKSNSAASGRISLISTDVCATLLTEARLVASKTPSSDAVAANNLAMPFKDQCFDAVVSVGVLHHFSTVERRLKALFELARLLRPSGRCLIYVWALEQPRRNFSAQDVLVPSDLRLKDEIVPTVVDTSWPVKNGRQVVFEEYPNWPDGDVSVMLGASKSASSSEVDSTDVSTSSTAIDSATNSATTSEATSPSSSSFFRRLLPSFIKGKSESSQVVPKSSIKSAPSSPRMPHRTLSMQSPSDHQPVENRRSLYRYYHVFCHGELENLVEQLNKQCHDSKLFHEKVLSVSSECSEDSQDATLPNGLRRVSTSSPCLDKESFTSDGNVFFDYSKSVTSTKMRLKVVNSFYDHANWVLELERVY